MNTVDSLSSERSRTKTRRLKRLWGTAIATLVAGIIALNAAAFLHARAMTTFESGAARTGRPEDLSWLQRAAVLVTGVGLPRPENRSSPSDFLLPATTETLVVDQSVALEIWMIEHPSPKGVVALFHGYGASKAQLLEEAAAIFSMNYSTCLVDFRGSGGSTGHTTTIGWSEADDVLAVCRLLRQRFPHQKLWLYGLSMGAAAVLRATSLEPACATGLILEGVFDRLLNAVKNRFRLMNLPPSPFAQLLTFWGGVHHGFNAFEHNPVDYAGSVHLPVLLLHGELDPRASVDEARAVLDRLRGPKHIEVFPGIGHQSTLNADSRRWRIVVGEFLKKTAPAPSGYLQAPENDLYSVLSPD